MPFIKYHIRLFQTLPYDWHWHIIEGVADLKYDTQWSLANGGKIVKDWHRNGLSKDGTTEYLNNLNELFSNRVSIYRKKGNEFWEGKVDMCNAFISELPSQCILWQVDVDELWDLESITRMLRLFEENPDRMGAFVYCHYFVGPKKFVTSMNTWATSSEDWFRVFRYFKGLHWKKHEPPTLVDTNGVDWGRKKPFTRDETLSEGIKFQHFAYVDYAQVFFKETYYGYANAVKYWNKLQKVKGEVDVGNYLPWAQKGAIAQDWVEETCGELSYPGRWLI